jgi:hypothetical protein
MLALVSTLASEWAISPFETLLSLADRLHNVYNVNKLRLLEGRLELSLTWTSITFWHPWHAVAKVNLRCES